MEKSILSPRQLEFLALINQEKTITQRFYWTGGTALSEFYLHHRFSEDIDLFCEDQEVDQRAVEAFLAKNTSVLGVQEIEKSQFLGLFSYHLIYNQKEALKVDFNYYPFTRIEKGPCYKNIQLDSLKDIAVNKIQTIATKPRARDFIDIYFIVKEKNFKFDALLREAKVKFDWHTDPLELGSQLMRARDVKDYPRMIKQIAPEAWQVFFLKEAKKLGKEILSEN